MPVDCEVFRGRSTITIEHLTGEVKPLERKVGDNIPGGARNLDGMLILMVYDLLQLSPNFLSFFEKMISLLIMDVA